MTGDVEKMIAVGLVWGATNALMRRGALIWDQSVKKLSTLTPSKPSPKLHQKLLASLKNWLALLLIWQYSVPFLLNLSASATFFAILSHTPISLAVPVTNATTFAATAFFGLLLGEQTRVGFSLLAARGFGSTLADTGWSNPLAMQPLARNLRNLDMKGALFQLVLTSPLLVAKLSAFHMLVCVLIPCLLGRQYLHFHSFGKHELALGTLSVYHPEVH